jgi:tripartite-type tricarboxylate transporter receptor subunit TctC
MHRTCGALIGCVVAAAAACASAQDYPARPVRLVAPFPAGGSNDLVSRTIAQKLGERWPHQMIVDNRPGAGGNLGAEIVAHATADGYTLLMGSSSLAVNATLYPKLSFNARTAFTAITLIGSSVHVLCVNPTVPAQTVKELIELAKAKPGQLNYASGGAGSPLHMNAELFSIMTGTRMVHVPYKGGPPAVAAVLANEAQLVFGSTTTVVPPIRSGRLRALGVSSAKRSRVLPEVPTIAEAGVPGYELVNWYGIVAPAGTAAAIVSRLNSDIIAAVNAPETSERMTAAGVEPNTSTAAEFADYLRGEISKSAELVKATGLKP